MKEPADVLRITDPVYEPKDSYNVLDRFLLWLIVDPRDLPFMHFIVEATLIIVPLVFYIYVGPVSWIVVGLYVPFNVFFYMDRFILLLHNTSHRPLFRREYRILNYYIVCVLGPLFGETPETDFAHHIGMHHVEENLDADLSSTLRYQRDSVTGWLRYFLRFFFGAVFALSLYMARKRRRKLLMRIVAGELAFWICVGIACLMNWQATLVVFVFPVIICRTLMIAGNWAQHAFIDPSRPDDPFGCTITVINCRYNRRSFNDGYHIGHHRKTALHWTEMPGEFLNNHELYRSRDAIVFSGIDFIMVWALLMFKRYDLLARHFVELRSPARSHEEIVALLKGRTQMIPVGPGSAQMA